MTAVPAWTGDEQSSRDWITAILGDAILPGIVTVEELDVGIDVDTKKAKGSDKPTSTDNGLKPARFRIDIWMNSRHWEEFQNVAPSFHPRRPGRSRGPLQFIHPLPNFLGITEVRVLSMKMGQPSALGGMKVSVFVEEWFDKPVPVKKATNEKPIAAGPGAGAGPNTVVVYGPGGVVERNRKSALREMSGQDPDFDPVTGKSNDPVARVENDPNTFIF